MCVWNLIFYIYLIHIKELITPALTSFNTVNSRIIPESQEPSPWGWVPWQSESSSSPNLPPEARKSPGEPLALVGDKSLGMLALVSAISKAEKGQTGLAARGKQRSQRKRWSSFCHILFTIRRYRPQSNGSLCIQSSNQGTSSSETSYSGDSNLGQVDIKATTILS